MPGLSPRKLAPLLVLLLLSAGAIIGLRVGLRVGLRSADEDKPVDRAAADMAPSPVQVTRPTARPVASPVTPSPGATGLPTPAPPPAAAPTTPPSAPKTVGPGPTATVLAPVTPAPSFTPNSPPAADLIDRRCPDPPPARPEYRRLYLSGQPWPTPDPAGFRPHFWLARPLPGSGRLLTNQWLPYGYDAGRYLLHNGTDVAEEEGLSLLAAAPGTIVVAGADDEARYGWRCDWYGRLVVLELAQRWRDQPVYVLYGHVQAIAVEVGQRVTTFEKVAEIGRGGAALLPHLHLEVRVGRNDFDSTRNPLLWFGPGATRGVIAGRLVDPLGRPWQGVPINAVSRSGQADMATTWTYLGDPQGLINPDEELAENFLFSDMRPGEYQLFLRLQGVEYSASVTVTAGAITPIEIVTEAFKTPTPAPAEADTPTP